MVLYKRNLATAWMIVVIAMPMTRATAQEESSASLSVAEFNKLANELHVKNQPWATIPWKVSVTTARAEAAKTKKPIFLVVNTGNSLGFV